METSLGLFLVSAAGISLTGVMFPGPMTAVTVAKGYSHKHAGAWIAVGHAVVEIPLMAAIYLGLAQFASSPPVLKTVYAVGGLMLFYLGFRMFRNAGRAPGEIGGLPRGSFVTGIVITGTNSAFYVWWVTLGVALVVGAARFGLIGLVLFAVVHWLCDLAWCEVLSISTFKSRKLWTTRVQQVVFRACALVLIGFGAWFIASALA
ncbi:MAG: LysE family transporter [Dehalococcoidia bacterium]|nr:LysE family transporter [Dehalococcoidia bacterium]